MKKFEFVLYINRNIICQRYFTVKNHNQNVKNSLDIKWCLEECVDLVKDDLKTKSLEYLNKQYNPYKVQTQEDVDTTVNEGKTKKDFYDFEIKMDDRVIAKTRFEGNIYPQRVRYSVDVRSLIPEIINLIESTAQQENFTVEYCGIEL